MDRLGPLLSGRSLVFARTPEQRTRGMAGRADASGMAMLFEASAGDVFWMQGCVIPLDLVFADAAGKVLGVETLQPPDGGGEPARTRCPEGTALVVEVAAGDAGKCGVEAGYSLWE